MAAQLVNVFSDPVPSSSTPASPDPTVPVLATAPVPQPKPPTPVDLIPFEFVRKDRTLVVCFDGTGDQFDKDNSNVVELLSMLKKDDRTRQMVYYQSGIGTYTGHDSTASTIKASVSKTLDSMFAWNMKNHVKEGYTFLMQNYVSGDRISLFGFSRGAYTARALAGMIHKMGLLPPGNEQQVPFAYNLFERTDDGSWDIAEIFKRSFAIDVRIDFIGVWDTVSSVGILDTTLPFSTSNNSIKYFRHAVSLDEHRAKFKANHWNPPSPDDQGKGTTYSGEKTDVKEVWFSGVHCDVGGGSVENGAEHSLAKISLRWMVKECFRCKTGILFKAVETYNTTGLTPELLQPPALDTHTYTSNDMSKFSTSSSVSAISEDETRLYDSESKDAVQKLNDQLVEKKAWWILEFLPLRRSIPGISRKNLNIFQKIKLFFLEHPFNNGEGRIMPLKDISGADVDLYVHHSVYERTKRVEEASSAFWALWWRKKQPYTPKTINWHSVQDKIIWTD